MTDAQDYTPEDVARLLRTWYEDWSLQFATWLADDPHEEYEAVLQQFPYLIKLTMSLLKDERVPIRGQLKAAAEYLMNPNDLLPEQKRDLVTLLDDTIVLVTPLLAVARWDAVILHSYWLGSGNPVTLLETIDEKRDEIVAFASDRRDD